MKITPNLSSRTRTLYVVGGIVLVAGSFMAGLDGWLRVSLGILGLATMAGGASGV